ncbi:hypothetical protein HMPREF1529_01806 [Microbacterium sp. oral taxon 186 str. F0373]|uniref:hypothetical protein n=1 Tax=Microbacterium sp. oral taxon 186 TaxID=712383 RepID=UPI00034E5F96|nr:hypothetical protein HMPREF1529_01806 [Microbacterium sp. oral taxon 186 str. F0373]
MATPIPLTDSDLLAHAVEDLATRTGLPVAFGGFERANAVEVTSVVGNRTPHLSGLVVHASRGLGGAGARGAAPATRARLPVLAQHHP